MMSWPTTLHENLIKSQNRRRSRRLARFLRHARLKRGARSGLQIGFILFFAGCKPEPAVHTVARMRILMDTLVSIKIFLPDSTHQAQASAAIDAAFTEMARLDSMLSSYRDDSEVAAINRVGKLTASRAGERGDNGFVISAEMDSVLSAALEVSRRSAGAFDVTIAPVLKLWGFGTDSLRLPPAEAIRRRLASVGFRHLTLERGGNHRAASAARASRVRFTQDQMAIDLGGIAKGFAVDRGMQTLVTRGFHDVMVEAGGDMRIKSSALTRGRRYIWIRHPRQADQFFGRFKVDSGAVATSGDYERFFEHQGRRYHHILDPKTGYPAWSNSAGDQVVSATVVAPTSMIADAFATAIFVMGPQAGIQLAEDMERLEAMVIFTHNGKLRWRATGNFKKKWEILAHE
jgi:thiamine biosynthesis lipoprotein